MSQRFTIIIILINIFDLKLYLEEVVYKNAIFDYLIHFQSRVLFE